MSDSPSADASSVQLLTDRVAVIETVDAIFDTCDAKDWAANQALFADKVTVDFTSLAGGEPAEVTAAQLVDGWRAGLHAKKQSFHLVGHHRVTLDGDTAEVHAKGYAHNLLAAELGGGMWEVWGNYAFTLTRTPGGWKATAMTFTAQHTRGDEAVRTHLLP
ncbi:hypothetical protein CFP65_3249 [Kitasatospora sp. MMS16-BH015]|uniref:nuclear transport factor 2 family protein n=1 Tax=Kitasatospora sp. MMS16-BH015 TaxID=2018025 RepID=UPI000CA120D1|nr:nuclear transport factor 2 family protein [Kitasatospora sp. MMS16-BH015]AUG78051.1 hypothetical protein CFP65_3249 [Kitasatospora sp. MMS16-BH015]